MDNKEAMQALNKLIEQDHAVPKGGMTLGIISDRLNHRYRNGFIDGWQAAQQQSSGEIARLEKEVDFWKKQSSQLAKDYEEEMAENEVYERDYNFMKDLAIGTEKLNLELKADNERLREALEDITTGFGVDCVCDSGHSAPYVAKQALSTPPNKDALKQYVDAEIARRIGEPVAWYDEKFGVMDEKHFDQMKPLYQLKD
jgi:hypothetical protein